MPERAALTFLEEKFTFDGCDRALHWKTKNVWKTNFFALENLRRSFGGSLRFRFRAIRANKRIFLLSLKFSKFYHSKICWFSQKPFKTIFERRFSAPMLPEVLKINCFEKKRKYTEKSHFNIPSLIHGAYVLRPVLFFASRGFVEEGLSRKKGFNCWYLFDCYNKMFFPVGDGGGRRINDLWAAFAAGMAADKNFWRLIKEINSAKEAAAEVMSGSSSMLSYERAFLFIISIHALYAAFCCVPRKYVWIVSLPSSAKKGAKRGKLLRWRGANDTVCTVSAITNCDALAVYNFSGETFSCRLTGGRKDKFKPLKISSLVRRNWRSWNLCRWNLLRMDGEDMQSA